MRPEAYVVTRAAQIIKGEDQASGRNGRFINQKRTNGQISSFGLRMADFILSRVRSLSAARPSNFYEGWQSELQFYQGPPAAVAVLSLPMAVLLSFINNGRFIKVEDQASGRNCRFINQKRPNCKIS